MSKLITVDEVRKQLVEEVRKQLVERDYYHSGQHWYEANVKVYSFGDIDEVLKKYPKRYHERIKEHFTDEYINSLRYEWLNQEYDQFKYEISDAKACLKDAKQGGWIIDAGLIDRAYNLITNDYLLGRSGGHWCIEVSEDYEDTLDNIEYELEDEENKLEDYQEQLQDILKDQLALAHILEFANRYAKSLEFNYELDFRVEEYIEELKKENQDNKEIKQAKTLASKHGYILAKEV